jgi:hypothetical protein
MRLEIALELPLINLRLVLFAALILLLELLTKVN